MKELYAAEFRRCLIEIDVSGILKIWRHVMPHLATLGPSEALCALHIARCEARSVPEKLKLYSVAWLAERGWQKSDGQWIAGMPKSGPIAEAVGISSGTASGQVLPFNRKVMRAMQDALLNGLEKNITEPPMQRELMLKARAKVRDKAARI